MYKRVLSIVFLILTGANLIMDIAFQVRASSAGAGAVIRLDGDMLRVDIKMVYYLNG